MQMEVPEHEADALDMQLPLLPLLRIGPQPQYFKGTRGGPACCFDTFPIFFYY